MPERVQLSRKKGWRKPENTVVVSRPSKWGNPYFVEKVADDEWAVCVHYLDGKMYAGAEKTEAAALSVVIRTFRERMWSLPGGLNAIKAELAGKDLACWCPLDQPCHADVLLEIANGGA